MKRKIVSFFIAVLVVSTAILLVKVFRPHQYHVLRLKQRAGTRYWDLPTGSRIGYTLIPSKGNKKPYPLIYLHGGPGAGITDLEIEKLSPLAEDGYDVYLYDQVGCGHSARLNNINEYTAARHNKDLQEITKKIQAEKVILIAQSWGSILSVLFLSDNPGKVAKIVITAPGVIQPPRRELENIIAPDSLQLRNAYETNRAINEKADDLRTKAVLYCARVLGKKIATDDEGDQFLTDITNELNKSMVCDTANAVTAEGTEGFYAHYMTRKSLSEIHDPRPKIRNSTVPVLIMKGQCDNQKWGFTTEYLQLFPNHVLTIIPGAGHNIFIEQPEAYIETIRNFLKK
jgi:proline iminopeptidase